MTDIDTVIRDTSVLNGSSTAQEVVDVTLRGDRIIAFAPGLQCAAEWIIKANGQRLAAGFIDVHTEDDLAVIRRPTKPNRGSKRNL